GRADSLPRCHFTSDALPPHLPLSLHDALPIWTALPSASTSWRSHSPERWTWAVRARLSAALSKLREARLRRQAISRTPWLMVASDRKSTRLNSSHVSISYAVFCLKKKTVDDKL